MGHNKIDTFPCLYQITDPPRRNPTLANTFGSTHTVVTCDNIVGFSINRNIDCSLGLTFANFTQEQSLWCAWEARNVPHPHFPHEKAKLEIIQEERSSAQAF